MSGKSVRFVLDLDKVASKEVKEGLEKASNRIDANSFKKYDAKEIEKRYGLKKGQFHREVKLDTKYRLKSFLTLTSTKEITIY